jgi:hypothetical protein
MRRAGSGWSWMRGWWRVDVVLEVGEVGWRWRWRPKDERYVECQNISI